MSDRDLHRLTAAPPDRSLDRLEADIWRGVRRARDRHVLRVAGAAQVGMLALIVFCSVTAGAGFALANSHAPHAAGLMPGLRLAPSALLLGS